MFSIGFFWYTFSTWIPKGFWNQNQALGIDFARTQIGKIRNRLITDG